MFARRPHAGRRAALARRAPVAPGSAYPLDFLGTADAQGDGTIVAYFDAAYSTLLDAPGGSDASDGGAVGSISDASGNEGPAVQATAGARPTLDADGFGGGPCLTFDGGDGLALSTLANTTEDQPYTLVVVGALGSASGRHYFCQLDSGFGAGYGCSIDNSNPRLWQMQIVGGDGELDGGTADTGDHIHVAVFDGASSAIYIDGSEAGTGTVTARAANGISIGQALGGASPVPSGSKVSAVALYSGNIGATARAYILAAAQARWSNLS